MQLKLSYPLEKVIITQRFGENQVDFYKKMGLLGHNGIDFHAIDGTPVYATHDGEITFAGEDGSAGLGVVIRTNTKYEYNNEAVFFKTIYWHLKTGSIVVKVNQQVKAGDLIGLADNTGMSTGSHLHFGLKPVKQGEQAWSWFNLEQNNGYGGAIDPLPYFDNSLLHPQATSSSKEFIEMQKAILAFQISEGITVFKDKPLEMVKYGPATLSKAQKYLK
jgi:murein DD-endopeptidase MepM/ murein hydrolase activator NlpD